MRATGNATISELVEDPFQCPEIPAVSVQKEVVRSIHHEQGSLHPEQERGTDPPPRHKNPHPQVPHLNVELINPLWEFPATVPRREITISNTELGPGPDMNAGLESQTAPVPAEPFHNAPQRGDWTRRPNPPRPARASPSPPAPAPPGLFRDGKHELSDSEKKIEGNASLVGWQAPGDRNRGRQGNAPPHGTHALYHYEAPLSRTLLSGRSPDPLPPLPPPPQSIRRPDPLPPLPPPT